MTIQNTKIVLTSRQATNENVYFRVQTKDIFISRVTQNDTITELVGLNLMSSTSVKFQIWNYFPHQILSSWNIDSASLYSNKKKYVIDESQWTVSLQILATGFAGNKQNQMGRDNKKSSIPKQFKTMDKRSRRNCSHCKQVNIAALKKNKDKAGVKKALKHTIQCLIKQEKEIKGHEYYDRERKEQIRTAKVSPSVKLISGIKNQSVLFSDYGFDSNQFNKQFAAKQTGNIENEQNQLYQKMERKKKSKVR